MNLTRLFSTVFFKSGGAAAGCWVTSFLLSVAASAAGAGPGTDAGEVTAEGLWLTSTAPNQPRDRFRVMADYVGRDGGAMVALGAEGRSGMQGDKGFFVRRGLVEEYSVSADGVRQDFVLAEAPGGTGSLRVELRVDGAAVAVPGGRDSHRAQTSIPAEKSGLRGSVALPAEAKSSPGATVLGVKG